MKLPHMRSRSNSAVGASAVPSDEALSQVQMLVEVAATGTTDDYAMVDALVARGVQRQTAMRLVALVPTAFAGRVLTGAGVTVSPIIEFAGNGGKAPASRRLDEFAEYRAAIYLSQSLRENSGFRALATHSAEFQAASQLMAQGSNPRNIRLTPGLTPWDIF